MLDFDKMDGLIPAVVQDHQSGEILMVAFQNREAYDRTVETGFMHYYSRSRGKQWMKGEQSGHRQKVHEIRVDCDEDALVYRIEQEGGAACHTGYRSCFYRRLDAGGGATLLESEKVFDPEKVYGQ